MDIQEKILKMKAEVYDLILEQNRLQNHLNELRNIINQKSVEIGKLVTQQQQQQQQQQQEQNKKSEK